MSYGAASAVLKREIETRLATRIPGALSPQPWQAPRLLSTGVPTVDRLLGGGLPLGGISEIAGSVGSGRTALALALVAEATQETACAYVDAGDSLNPVSAAAAGIRMENLLWVRLGSRAVERQPLPVLLVAASEQTGENLPDVLARKAAARQKREERTPGHPNQVFGLAAAPDEQVAYERLFERGHRAGTPRQEAGAEAKQLSARSPVVFGGTPKSTWDLLDQAIRTTDQILQSGGFRVVVLDLASAAPEQTRRISAATWFRFRRAAQESDAVLLLLTGQPCAGSSAACLLNCRPGAVSIENGILRAMAHAVEVARQRTAVPGLGKSPGRSAVWEAVPHWMRMGRAEA